MAEHFNDPDCLKDVALDELDDETLESKLVAVKGLGRWSVHMFMIFHLRRANVLATGDLGIRNGMTEFFKLPKKSLEIKGNQGEMRIQTLCQAWKPYSSVGCCLMWKLADAAKASSTTVASGSDSIESEKKNGKKNLVLPVDV